ncbi:MAG: hypothetical protein HY808_15660 [Nitrospirae bacterium]|nr:hypothetical protein [Nitrospirota bacterium]
MELAFKIYYYTCRKMCRWLYAGNSATILTRQVKAVMLYAWVYAAALLFSRVVLIINSSWLTSTGLIRYVFAPCFMASNTWSGVEKAVMKAPAY